MTEKIRSAVWILRQAQGKVVTDRSADERAAAKTALITIFFANLLTFLLTALTILDLLRKISARRHAEEKLKESGRRLQGWVGDLEKQNKEYSILGETVDVLQSCVTLEEACRVIDCAHTEARSVCNGISLVKLMGRQVGASRPAWRAFAAGAPRRGFQTRRTQGRAKQGRKNRRI